MSLLLLPVRKGWNFRERWFRACPSIGAMLNTPRESVGSECRTRTVTISLLLFREQYYRAALIVAVIVLQSQRRSLRLFGFANSFQTTNRFL